MGTLKLLEQKLNSLLIEKKVIETSYYESIMKSKGAEEIYAAEKRQDQMRNALSLELFALLAEIEMFKLTKKKRFWIF